MPSWLDVVPHWPRRDTDYLNINFFVCLGSAEAIL